MRNPLATLSVASDIGRSPDPIVQWPRTPPFHGGNTGSNPVRVALLLHRRRNNLKRERFSKRASAVLALFSVAWPCAALQQSVLARYAAGGRLRREVDGDCIVVK